MVCVNPSQNQNKKIKIEVNQNPLIRRMQGRTKKAEREFKIRMTKMIRE